VRFAGWRSEKRSYKFCNFLAKWHDEIEMENEPKKGGCSEDFAAIPLT